MFSEKQAHAEEVSASDQLLLVDEGERTRGVSVQLGGAKGGGVAGERGPRMCLRWRGKAGAKSRDMYAPLSLGIDFPRWVS